MALLVMASLVTTPLLFPNETPGKVCFPVHEFLSKLRVSPQLSASYQETHPHPQPLAL